MVNWITEKNPSSILDPSVGTGIFLRTISEDFAKPYHLDCYDIDSEIVSYIDDTTKPNSTCKVVIEDFLTADIRRKYDAVIMNPPYLRHHDMSYSFDIHEKIGNISRYMPSRLANAYVLFAMKACELLAEGGRAAFIMPAEWANANFGKSFKDYLLERAVLKQIIYFSNCHELFSDALTTSCILLIEKTSDPAREIAVSYVDGVVKSFNSGTVRDLNAEFKSRKIAAPTLREVPKWDYLIRNGNEIRHPGFVKLSNLASSKRGIATGANEYFHVPKVYADEKRIRKKHRIPCVGKAIDVKGLVFTNENFNDLVARGAKTELLSFSGMLNDNELEYIKQGEKIDLHHRYLLSRRTPWYSMESREPAPIWAAVFGRTELRFIYNEAMVANLTTFHGIYPYSNSKNYIKALTVLLNSGVVQEMARAHVRVYGGGLLKFEPNDLLHIQVPDLRRLSPHLIGEIASMLDAGGIVSMKKANQLVEKAAAEAAV